MSGRDPWNSKYQYQCQYKTYGNNGGKGQVGAKGGCKPAIAPPPNRGNNSNSRGALCTETKYQVTVTQREFHASPAGARNQGAVGYSGQGGSNYKAVQQNGAATSNSRGARRADHN
ncbi:Hypothetical predicted protein [Drosophila guanche]|uniref:Uncharacterized protein n=1 Tax=Drosophila guanche TaxID=7266 RepID=A0A3B0J1N1_DROGU|nr:Hypothetical predicted protein [Drosophila guanche]